MVGGESGEVDLAVMRNCHASIIGESVFSVDVFPLMRRKMENYYSSRSFLLPPKLQRRGLVFERKLVTMERV